MRHNVRQAELAERMGYEQSYISALEQGVKGPPTQAFLDAVAKAFLLSEDEIHELHAAAEASQRKLVIDADVPQDVYWLLSRLRATVHRLTPTQVRVINDVLGMADTPSEVWSDQPLRLRRRRSQEAKM